MGAQRRFGPDVFACVFTDEATGEDTIVAWANKPSEFLGMASCQAELEKSEAVRETRATRQYSRQKAHPERGTSFVASYPERVYMLLARPGEAFLASPPCAATHLAGQGRAIRNRPLLPRTFNPVGRNSSFGPVFSQEFVRPVQRGLGFVPLAIVHQWFDLLHDPSDRRWVAPLLLPTADARLHPLSF